jgi:hypothetical protein
MAQRQLGDLQIDSSKARKLLDWQPTFTMAHGLVASLGVSSRG